jgi:hypothetical protein
MKKTAMASIVLVFAASSVLALNPIHESTYLAYASGLSQGEPTLHVAAIIPKGGETVGLPLGLSLALGSRLEIGGGVKTQWGGGGNPLAAFVFGAQYGLSGRTALGLHLLLDADNGDNQGLTLTWHQRGGLSRKISTEADLRLGLLDALVENKALFALEGSYGLALAITRGVGLQVALITSSQTKQFNDHFALDLEPGLRVGTGRQSAVETVFTVGLAGERREDFRVKVGWIQAF